MIQIDLSNIPSYNTAVINMVMPEDPVEYEKTILRMRQAQRGKKQTQEHIAKRVAKNIGKKRTPEQIERFKIAQKGRIMPPKTESQKKAMSEIIKNQWSSGRRKMTEAHKQALQDGLKKANVWTPKMREQHSKILSKALIGIKKSVNHR